MAYLNDKYLGKIVSKILVLALILFSSSSFAESQSDLVERLVKAQRLTELWEEQMQAGKLAGQQQAEQMLSQILSRLNPNDTFKNRFSDAFNNFLVKLESPWSAAELTAIFASYYGPQFSDEELIALAEFYESKLGQKEIESARFAITKFSEELQAKSQPILESAMNGYLDELRIIVKDCNCTK